MVQGFASKVELLSWSSNFTPLIELEGSVSCSEKPATSPYSERIQSIPPLHTIFVRSTFIF